MCNSKSLFKRCQLYLIFEGVTGVLFVCNIKGWGDLCRQEISTRKIDLSMATLYGSCSGLATDCRGGIYLYLYSQCRWIGTFKGGNSFSWETRTKLSNSELCTSNCRCLKLGYMNLCSSVHDCQYWVRLNK